MQWILPKRSTCHSAITRLNQCDCAVSANPLPWQTEHQRLKLFSVEFDFQAAMSARPMEFPLVQPPCGKPDAHAIMHQHLHPVGTAIGEQISAVRLRRTEHCDHAGQRRVGAVSVPARMSMGSVASQMASMRIIAIGCG